MAAAVDITGTWTALTFDTSQSANVGQIDALNLNSLLDDQGEIQFPELISFTTQMATGYGITYGQALSLLEHLFRAERMRSQPTRKIEYP